MAATKFAFPPPDTKELLSLFPASQQISFPRGLMIFRESSAADACYYVIEGRVQINKKVRGKAPRLKVAVIKPGEFFGEMAMLSGLPRSASALALTDVKALRISREEFARLVDKNHPVAASLAIYFSSSLARRGMQMLRLLGRSYGANVPTRRKPVDVREVIHQAYSLWAV
jgi:CRP-like cAMP-binding protein